MRPEPNAPWWLSVAISTLPVALAIVLVVVFPPGHRTASTHPAPAVAARPAMADLGADGELCVLTASR